MPSLFSIKATITGKGRDRLPTIIKDYKALSNAYVATGWDKHSGRYPSGLLVAQNAIFQEFGTFDAKGQVEVPARPFMRPAYQNNKNAINALRIKVIQQLTDGKINTEKALDILGFRMMTYIQNAIKSNTGPELADGTLAKKRREGKPAVTLIDTRLMLDSLTYKVYLGKLDFAGKQTDFASSATGAARQSGDKANQRAVARKAAFAQKVAKQQAKAAMRRTSKTFGSRKDKDT
jgi:hypothetical protein